MVEQSSEIDKNKARSDTAREFVDWCAKVGICSQNLEYPALFDGGTLVGVKAVKEIKHRQAILSVPFTSLISVDKRPLLVDVKAH